MHDHLKFRLVLLAATASMLASVAFAQSTLQDWKKSDKDKAKNAIRANQKQYAAFLLQEKQDRLAFGYYDHGNQLVARGDYQRALEEFRSAASLRFEETQSPGAGYHPHRGIGICLFHIGDLSGARKALELSVAYGTTEEAKKYLEQLPSEGAESDSTQHPPSADQDKEHPPFPSNPDKATSPEPQPAGTPAAKDASSLPQVGPRLSLAVLPVDTGKGDGLHAALAEQLTAALVRLHRFKVVERLKVDKIVEEQNFQTSDLADPTGAVQVGKLSGAEAVILSKFVADGDRLDWLLRVVDVEDAEIIATADVAETEPQSEHPGRLAGDAAASLANDLPILEGTVIELGDGLVYVDLGAKQHIRRGMKFVAYREGGEIRHPVTHEVLGRKVLKLADLLVSDIQERISSAKVVGTTGGELRVGDKVIVK